jgi:hypothetical protein
MHMLDTLRYDRSGQTLVIVHTSEAPSDQDWDGWLERMGQHDYRNILIVSRGGGPTAAQRRKTNKFWMGKSVPKFALVTTSRFVIGIVKAFNWFLDDQLRPYHPDDFELALDYIEVPDSERDALRVTVGMLQKQLEQRAA